MKSQIESFLSEVNELIDVVNQSVSLPKFEKELLSETLSGRKDMIVKLLNGEFGALNSSYVYSIEYSVNECKMMLNQFK